MDCKKQPEWLKGGNNEFTIYKLNTEVFKAKKSVGMSATQVKSSKRPKRFPSMSKLYPTWSN